MYKAVERRGENIEEPRYRKVFQVLETVRRRRVAYYNTATIIHMVCVCVCVCASLCGACSHWLARSRDLSKSQSDASNTYQESKGSIGAVSQFVDSVTLESHVYNLKTTNTYCNEFFLSNLASPLLPLFFSTPSSPIDNFKMLNSTRKVSKRNVFIEAY